MDKFENIKTTEIGQNYFTKAISTKKAFRTPIKNTI